MRSFDYLLVHFNLIILIKGAIITSIYTCYQSPQAWYERLIVYLRQQGYVREKTDKTLFINQKDKDIIVDQIYVDDIFFYGFSDENVSIFVNITDSKFEMSMLGELSFFLGLQIKQDHNGIFIFQEKYAKNIVNKFGLETLQSKNEHQRLHK